MGRVFTLSLKIADALRGYGGVSIALQSYLISSCISY